MVEKQQQSPTEGMSAEQGTQGVRQGLDIRGQWPLSHLKKKKILKLNR